MVLHCTLVVGSTHGSVAILVWDKMRLQSFASWFGTTMLCFARFFNSSGAMAGNATRLNAVEMREATRALAYEAERPLTFNKTYFCFPGGFTVVSYFSLFVRVITSIFSDLALSAA